MSIRFGSSGSFLIGLAALVSTGSCNRARVSPGLTEPVVRTSTEHPMALNYPQAPRSDHQDDYHGVQVADPYRWLEDIDSEATRSWVEAENKVTAGYLASIPEREAILQRLTKLWDFERWGVPAKHGSIYSVSHNDGLQDQSVIYAMTSLDAEPRVLFDPNTMSKDGTVALQGLSFSDDGSKVVWSVSEAGSDWERWKVRDVATGQDSDELRWIKFATPSWAKDGKGFFYSKYDAPKDGDELEALNYNQKLFYHRLGSAQSDDLLIHADPAHKEWSFDGEVTDDGKYLVVTVRVGTDPNNAVLIKPLSRAKPGATQALLPDFDAHYEWVGSEGDILWFLTDKDAPRQRLIGVDVKRPEARKWRTLIPEQVSTLRGVRVVGDRFVASYLSNARSKVTIHGLDGKLEHTVKLPGLGTAGGFSGERKHSESFFQFTSFAVPTTVYRLEVASGTIAPVWTPKLDFNPEDFTATQVFYPSRDGTQIPMFIAHKKGLKLDGSHPTYLYGYGGFNIPLTPSFSVPDLVWMEMGGVYAMPNLRGGGEFGETWHQAGTKLNKQNVFDDFISAAQYLIKSGYTQPKHLAIGGRSNGGLLVGATMTQRPDLFAAALPGVGVMDMLRFNKFTIGWAWESDYGSPQDAEQFSALYAYSPYHNLAKDIEYPATMVYTADHDDRVLPAHSYKFAAALQHAHVGERPVLIRVDTRAGHGSGKPTAKQIAEWADLWAFLVKNLAFEPSFASQGGGQ